MTEIEERRQRALEAGADAMTRATGTAESADGIHAVHLDLSAAFSEAIETATRVQITPEVLRAAQDATECDPAECDPCIEKALIAALGLLGFEVVE